MKLSKFALALLLAFGFVNAYANDDVATQEEEQTEEVADAPAEEVTAE